MTSQRHQQNMNVACNVDVMRTSVDSTRNWNCILCMTHLSSLVASWPFDIASAVKGICGNALNVEMVGRCPKQVCWPNLMQPGGEIYDSSLTARQTATHFTARVKGPFNTALHNTHTIIQQKIFHDHEMHYRDHKSISLIPQHSLSSFSDIIRSTSVACSY